MNTNITNHLWQSTVFAVAAFGLTLALRGNRASVRYWVWFSASVKFLFPFAVLMGVGGYLHWAPAARVIAPARVSVVVERIAVPFSDVAPVVVAAAPRGVDWVAAAIFAVWACGFIAVAAMRVRGWVLVRAAVLASRRIEIAAGVGMSACATSAGVLEPGVVGWWKPILLLPEGIETRLTPEQLEAVVAHELCHVRRRDNLFAAIHMIVEAVFWFHPLVWWIGARLVETREMACDEEVLRLGSEPRVYADGILNVCKSYVESPLACVAGVTGADIKKRIEAIMSERAGRGLSFAKKMALAGAAVAALAIPFALGVRAADTPKFEVVSIRPCGGGDLGGRGRGGTGQSSPGLLNLPCVPVRELIWQAYVEFGDAQFNLDLNTPIEGGPGWIGSDRYRVEAKAESPQREVMMNGPMLQTVLEDRFKLKIHRETREVPVYALTVAKGGAKLEAYGPGSCIAWEYGKPIPGLVPGQPLPLACGMVRWTMSGMDMHGETLAALCAHFSGIADRPVIDRTGIEGMFNIHLDVTPEDLGYRKDQSDQSEPDDAAIFAAVRTAVRKLGLQLDATRGPAEFLVIDSVERPSEN